MLLSYPFFHVHNLVSARCARTVTEHLRTVDIGHFLHPIDDVAGITSTFCENALTDL